MVMDMLSGHLRGGAGLSPLLRGRPKFFIPGSLPPQRRQKAGDAGRVPRVRDPEVDAQGAGFRGGSTWVAVKIFWSLFGLTYGA